MASKQETIGSNSYTFDKMNLFSAGDVARIWSYALMMLSQAPKSLSAVDFARSFPTFIPFVPKAENDAAMTACLATVKRSLGNDKGWAALVNDGKLMYQDLSLSEMYQLIFHVLDVNELLHFFGDPLEPSKEEAARGEA